MKLFKLFLCLILTTPALSSDTGKSELRSIYARFESLVFDAANTAEVNDLVLRRDRATIRLEQGTLYVTEPIRGHITGAVFIGEGRLQLTPPNDIERASVRRFLDKDSLDEKFFAAYFRFADKTISEIEQQVTFGQDEIPDKARELHEKITELFLKDRRVNLTSQIMTNLINGAHDPFFLGVFEHEQARLNLPNYFILDYSPNSYEGVEVFQYFPHRAKNPFYTLCAFSPESYGSQTDMAEDRFVRIDAYELQLDLEDDGEVQIEAKLTFTSTYDSLRMMGFRLFPELRIDSVKNANGDSLGFIKKEKEAGFSILFEEPLPSAEDQHLSVFYSGDLLRRRGANFLLKNNLYWYPRAGYLVPATYKLRFTYPDRLQLLAIGTKVTESVENGDKISEWEIDVTGIGAVFGLGDFDSTSMNVPGIAPIYVYSTAEHSRSLREDIARDLANSLYFFHYQLGGYPYEYLNVVESPSILSFGFPGLVFLTTQSFIKDRPGRLEALRAHELSHMWWGNLIGWQTYHDQWLSEALAEYSGALATQFAFSDDKVFFQILESWRTDLFEKGHVGVSLGLQRFGFSKSDLRQSEGLHAGPIWLGRRLGEKHGVDYYLNVYEKGAYVIHMLRTMLRDFDTGSDARFWEMLRDYVAEYRGKKATTDDFRKIVEKHLDQDMDWFFDQWIYGTDVPKYVYSYEIEEAEDGYRVALRVRQEDVEPDFKAMVPVGIAFRDRPKVTECVTMTGAASEFTLGPYSSRPQRIQFNDFAGVLAGVERK